MKIGRQFSVKLDSELTKAVDEWLSGNPDIKQATLAVMAIRKFVTEKQTLSPVTGDDNGRSNMTRTKNLIIQETSPDKLRAWYFRSEALWNTKSLVLQNENAPEEVLEHAVLTSGDELTGSIAIENPSISTNLLIRVVRESSNENLKKQANFILDMRSKTRNATKSAG